MSIKFGPPITHPDYPETLVVPLRIVIIRSEEEVERGILPMQISINRPSSAHLWHKEIRIKNSHSYEIMREDRKVHIFFLFLCCHNAKMNRDCFLQLKIVSLITNSIPFCVYPFLIIL
jgi:hypothetical protein